MEGQDGDPDEFSKKRIKKENDLDLEGASEGPCFLCLEESSTLNLNNSYEKTTTVCLRNVGRYLNISPEKYDFSVVACPTCASLYNSLSELIRRIEMTNLLIHHKLEQVRRILTDSETRKDKPEAAEQECQLKMLKIMSMMNLSFQLPRQRQIPIFVEELRKETKHKCSLKLEEIKNCALPKVHLTRMTTAKVPTKIEIPSTISSSTAPDTTFETPKQWISQIYKNLTPNRSRYQCPYCTLIVPEQIIRSHLLLGHLEKYFVTKLSTNMPETILKRICKEIVYDEVKTVKQVLLREFRIQPRNCVFNCLHCDLTFNNQIRFKCHYILEHFTILKEKIRVWRKSKYYKRKERKGKKRKVKGQIGIKKRRKTDIMPTSDKQEDSSNDPGNLQVSTNDISNLQDSPNVTEELTDSSTVTDNLEDSSNYADNLQDNPNDADNLEDSPNDADDLDDSPNDADNLEVSPNDINSLGNIKNGADNLQCSPNKTDNLEDNPIEAVNQIDSPFNADNQEDSSVDADSQGDTPIEADNPEDILPDIDNPVNILSKFCKDVPNKPNRFLCSLCSNFKNPQKIKDVQGHLTSVHSDHIFSQKRLPTASENYFKTCCKLIMGQESNHRVGSSKRFRCAFCKIICACRTRLRHHLVLKHYKAMGQKIVDLQETSPGVLLRKVTTNPNDLEETSEKDCVKRKPVKKSKSSSDEKSDWTPTIKKSKSSSSNDQMECIPKINKIISITSTFQQIGSKIMLESSSKSLEPEVATSSAQSLNKIILSMKFPVVPNKKRENHRQKQQLCEIFQKFTNVIEPRKLYQCIICPVTYTVKSSTFLRRHLVNSHPEKFFAQEQQRFKLDDDKMNKYSKKMLMEETKNSQDHVENCGTSNNVRFYDCQVCGRTIRGGFELRFHLIMGHHGTMKKKLVEMIKRQKVVGEVENEEIDPLSMVESSVSQEHILGSYQNCEELPVDIEHEVNDEIRGENVYNIKTERDKFDNNNDHYVMMLCDEEAPKMKIEKEFELESDVSQVESILPDI